MLRARVPLLLAACAAIGAAACGPATDQTISAPGSVAAPAGLAQPGSLTVALPTGLPPYGFHGGNGTNQGFNVDLSAAMATRLGVRLRVVAVTPQDLLVTGRAGLVDVVMGTTPLTVDASPPAGFELVPYIRGGSELMVPVDGAFQPRQLDELCGRSVAVVAGTRQESVLAGTAAACGPSPPHVDATPDNADAVRALRQRTADAYLADSATAAYDKASDGGLMTTSGVLDDTELGLALRTDSATVRDAVIRAYYSVHSDGTYEVLVKKWGLTAQQL